MSASSTTWAKAAAVGAVGSVVMFALMVPAIGAGLAPFKVPPSAALLERLGLAVGPLPLLLHLGYGAFWSAALVALFGERVSLARGLALGLALWLLMMVAVSPMIGWGLFGAAAGARPPDDLLHLASTGRYLASTLVLHVVYGLVVGTLDPLWLYGRRREARREAGATS